MRTGGTISILFTDIVGSTDLLSRLGDARWDDARRSHFTALREVLAAHSGTEVKNTGDGLMAAFSSAVDAVDCSIAMQARVRREGTVGSPITIRIGLSAGEAASEGGDWFGSPVVEAARLCALAGPGESWATSIVRTLVGSFGSATFHDLGPTQLKGFERPVDVVAIQPGPEVDSTFWASVDDHEPVISDGMVRQLDFWEALPSIRAMRTSAVAALAPMAGDRICDIGSGSGTELIRLARIIGAGGRAVGVDASQLMCDEAQRRAAEAGVDIDVVCSDGRETGLPDGEFDGVRIERVIQHVGDVSGFLREALRIVRPGGRIVIADTDWGSLMIHPGDRALVNRLKSLLQERMPEPWAGRMLHGAMLDAGLVDVSSSVHSIAAGPGIAASLSLLMARRVAQGVGTQAEMEAFNANHGKAMERGDGVYAFSMFVAWGRRPEAS